LDGTIKIWNLMKGGYISTIEPSQGSLCAKKFPISSVKFNPYEKQFICSGGSKTLHLFDFDNFEKIKESRIFPTLPSHLEYEAQGDYVLVTGENFMHCLNNDDLRTVASYNTNWKRLHNLVTVEVNQIPYVVGFELTKSSVKMYSNNYLDLFPFRVFEDEQTENEPKSEETNYVVEKKPQVKK
jgi:WD40 repeat protein